MLVNFAFRSVVVGMLLIFSSCAFPRFLINNKPSIYDDKNFPTATINNSIESEDCSHGLINAPTELPALEKWVLGGYKAKDKSIEEFLEETNTTAFMVVRNDSLLFESYNNDYEPTEPNIVFSVCKSIITSLVDIAIQNGHIESIEQSVADFIPSFKENGKEHVKIKHLLNMTSGLHHDDYGKLVLTGSTYYHTNLDKVVDGSRVKVEPDTEFIYKSMDTQILGSCIEAASQTDIVSYIQKYLWEPLGMCNEARFTLDSRKNKNARMFGGMAISSNDLLKFGLLFLNDGVYNGKRIISKEWVEQIKNRKNKKGAWYGYENGWWRDTFVGKSYLDDQDFYAAGFFGQYIYIDPQNNTMVIRLGENKGKVRWQKSLSKLSKTMNKEDFNIYFSQIKPNSICGIYRSDDDQMLYLSCKDTLERTWKMQWHKNEDHKLSVVMKSSCENTIYNLFKNISLIFNHNRKENMILLDDGKGSMTSFVKVK